MEQKRSKSGLLIFLGIVALSIVSVFWLLHQFGSQNSDTEKSPAGLPNNESSTSPTLANTLNGDGGDVGESQTPEELIGRITEIILKANESGDATDLLEFIGRENLSPEQIKQITELAASGKLQLKSKQPISKAPGEPHRWQLNFADNTSISLELKQNENGSWQVNSISLPRTGTGTETTTTPTTEKKHDDPAPEVGSAEAHVKGFMEAITRLDAVAASQYIDQSKVSHVTLAGLCIIFEEGEYTLLKTNALRKMFVRDTASGWVARLKSENAGESAMFAINTKRADIDAPWKITEINLDNLLTDYAKGMLGGDIHYSPLIKNPKGGDSLAIYFDLDAKDLIPRTKRQLNIVANLLKADKTKKLTITGHTDALGTDLYNLALSKERADAVMSFLAQSGVEPAQMNIVGYGETQPRLPNTADDGSDSPEGRRANRRAEILLDF